MWCTSMKLKYVSLFIVVLHGKNSVSFDKNFMASNGLVDETIPAFDKSNASFIS